MLQPHLENETTSADKDVERRERENEYNRNINRLLLLTIPAFIAIGFTVSCQNYHAFKKIDQHRMNNKKKPTPADVIPFKQKRKNQQVPNERDNMLITIDQYIPQIREWLLLMETPGTVAASSSVD